MDLERENVLLLFRVFTEWSQYYCMVVRAHKYITRLATPHTGGLVRTYLLVESGVLFPPSKLVKNNSLNIQQEYITSISVTGIYPILPAVISH